MRGGWGCACVCEGVGVCVGDQHSTLKTVYLTHVNREAIAATHR